VNQPIVVITGGSRGIGAATAILAATRGAGVIYTELHASGSEPGRVDRVKDTVPLKRGGQPEEVARAILWLLSDEASYTTGALLDVSGGK
jgi:NAD(P)-dependent dehydrogenase (short-subunit alcohol dehydrogenase family)